MKKSWHTATLRNIEKVWKLETAAEEEAKKLAILKKEKEKERALANFRKLHEESQSGMGAGFSMERRMDWMHGGGDATSSGSAVSLQEEYLLGKRKATDILDKPSSSREDLTGGIEAFLGAAQSATAGGPLGTLPTFVEANSRKDLESKFREDPLFMVKKNENKEIQDILHAKLLAKKSATPSTTSFQRRRLDDTATPANHRNMATPARHREKDQNYYRERDQDSVRYRERDYSTRRGNYQEETPRRPQASTNQRPPPKSYKFTEEERQARLAAMQQSAEVHHASRSQKVREEDQQTRQEQAQFQHDYKNRNSAVGLSKSNTNQKDFIEEARASVYSLSGGGASEKNLSKELHAKRAYLQKDND